MNNKRVVIVLGKRLNKNTLTAEGKSRVEGLVEHLETSSRQNIVVAFCGGITSGQTRSEAEAMHEYFASLQSNGSIDLSGLDILLEKESVNTIENIQNVAKKMVDENILSSGECIKVTFVSNDYHLKRIFEIQQLMDEQGLLRVLKRRCSEFGAELDISYELDDHLAIPYPHRNIRSQLFLLMDELTTYRVYLEGVVSGVFLRDLKQVRKEPYRIAANALVEIKQLLAIQTEESSVNLLMVDELASVLHSCVENTPVGASVEQVRTYLALLDTNLTLLNRYLDPEQELTFRWWR